MKATTSMPSTNPIVTTPAALSDNPWDVKLGELDIPQATAAFNAIVATLEGKAKEVIEREHAAFATTATDIVMATNEYAAAFAKLERKTLSFREQVQGTMKALVKEAKLELPKARKLVTIWATAYGFKANSVNAAIAKMREGDDGEAFVQRRRKLTKATKGEAGEANALFDRLIEAPLGAALKFGFGDFDPAAVKASKDANKGGKDKGEGGGEAAAEWDVESLADVFAELPGEADEQALMIAEALKNAGLLALVASLATPAAVEVAAAA